MISLHRSVVFTVKATTILPFWTMEICTHGVVTCSIGSASINPKRMSLRSSNLIIKKLKIPQIPVDNKSTYSKTQTVKMTYPLQIEGLPTHKIHPTICLRWEFPERLKFSTKKSINWLLEHTMLLVWHSKVNVSVGAMVFMGNWGTISQLNALHKKYR